MTSLLYTCAPCDVAATRATAARKVVRKPPARRKAAGSLTVDVHCHVLTLAAEALAKPVYSPDRDHLMLFANDITREVNRAQVVTVREHLTSVEKRLADMDRMGIDVQAISTAPPQFYYWMDADLGRQTSRLINENLTDIAARHPDRFAPLGTLPMQDPRLAVEEAEHCMKRLGMRGVEICTNVNGKDLSDPSFEPVFAKLEQLGAVIFLHPNGFSEAQRLSEHYFNNVIGNPLDTSMALSHLIFGGVLDRHPKLKIIAAHGGGFIGSYPFRMDHAHGARRDCRVNIRKKPTSYLKKVFFDTIVFDHAQLRHLVNLWGADHIVAGTDYPYDMGHYEPCTFVDKATFLTRAQKDAIKGLTAAKLLGIKPPKRRA